MDANEPLGRGGRSFVLLLLGIALGVAGTILVVQWVAPYVVESFRGGRMLEGQVLDKVPEADRLLLKVTTEHGVFLATFTQKQEEIDLLVDPGDTITLGVPQYEAFLEDPTIKRVRQPEQRMEPTPPPPETGIRKEVGLPEETEPPPEPTNRETPEG